MSQISLSNVHIQRINQVGIVVKDIEKMVEAYWNILGVGPWSIVPWEPPLVYDRKYHGKPSVAKEKIAVTQVGAVQLELVQPIEGDSIYRDFLEEHGEGLHHLNFSVDDVDQVADTLEREGFPSLQSARFGPPEEKGAFSYIHIEPLHTIWEPVHVGRAGVAEFIRYTSLEQSSPAKVQIKGIKQVGIVVKDIEKMVEAYGNILGIGPWSIVPWEPPLVYDRKYHGKPSVAKEKIAVTQVGAVQLELVQPIEGDSIYRDFLEEHGEGLHHLNFSVDDVDQVADTLEREGFPSLQSARFGPPEQKGAFNYVYIKPLHTIWEPVHVGTR